MKAERTVFLDRDGVINVLAPTHDYIRTWSAFRFLPGVKEAIRLLNERGFRVVIVTNQRGVARGLMTMADLNDIHIHMEEELEASGAHVDAIYVCPHEKGTCHCRKPEIGLFLQAERETPVDKAHSYMIGDSDTDIQAGKRYGVHTIAVNCETLGADWHCGSLREAVDWIIKEETT